VSGAGYRLLTRGDELTAGVERWSSRDSVALDTEFVFERTFLPRPGLAQIAAGDEVVLVDLVALPRLEALAPLLSSPSTIKIFHSGSADVDLLGRLSGARPRRIFDTQVGAAFAGLGNGLSYGALVATLFGVELGKSETRTDWTSRPLRPAQLRYAAEDVAHLEAAAHELRRRLSELGRLAWAEEESESLVDEMRSASDEPWRRLRGLGRLPQSARGVGRALAAWREREARRLDLARPFLLRDETLLALARRATVSVEDLPRLPGYDRRRHERHAPAWIAAHAAALAAPLADPADERTPGGSRDWQRREKLSREIAGRVERFAAGLGLPPELLLSRRQRHRLLAAWDGERPVAEGLGGFRRELLGPLLADVGR